MTVHKVCILLFYYIYIITFLASFLSFYYMIIQEKNNAGFSCDYRLVFICVHLLTFCNIFHYYCISFLLFWIVYDFTSILTSLLYYPIAL